MLVLNFRKMFMVSYKLYAQKQKKCCLQVLQACRPDTICLLGQTFLPQPSFIIGSLHLSLTMGCVMWFALVLIAHMLPL